MKIGIEAQRIFRPNKHGMDVVGIELIRNLQEIDTENEYIVFARSGVNDIFNELPNFHIKTFRALSYADWEQIFLVNQVRKQKLDVLHCTANTAPLRLSAPLIVTVHDIIYLEELNFKGTAYQNFGNLYRKFVVPRIAEKAKIVLTVSEFERQNIIQRLDIPRDKVKVLYNGVGSQFNINYQKEIVENFRRKFALPSEFIMFLGNTAPKKNTLNVIRAYVDFCLQTSSPVPLVLLDYKKEFVQRILTELGQSHLLSNFVFPGYIPYSQIPLMYNAASLFLYPSLRESFGLPILEAMACGVPVITSNTSSMPEIAGEAAEIVDPLNYKSISGAISNVLSNESSRTVYIRKGLERVKMFTWRKSAEQLRLFYENI
jgi:glycosyltransferase involved in cell wall biosynthesis